MEWIDCKDKLPEIDYEKGKSSVEVSIKLDNDLIVGVRARHIASLDENGYLNVTGIIFYDLFGEVYLPKSWKYISNKKARK